MSSLKKQINSLLDHKFWKKGENICTQYFKACELCDEIYNKGMVLMQVGSFFEAYGVNNKYIQRGHANLIGDIFNIAVTRKGKKKYAEELGNRKIEDLTKKQLIKLHEKYPLMSGMNELVIEKYLRIAIENGYTVVLIEQLEQPTKGMMVRRGVTKIVSPGTFIETSSKDKNNIASIFIEKVMKKKQPYFCIGLSLIDATTGENIIFEVFDKKTDNNYALDETIRFILSNTTSEILINTKNIDMTENDLLSRLQLYNHKLVNIKLDKLPSDFYKINFQERFLKKIFPDTGLLKAYEYLDLEKMEYARLSYIILLNHVYQYSEILIKNISKPIIINNDKYLNLDTTTISQLNVTNNQKTSLKTKYTSLFDVINFTSTAMGRRLLKHNILNPIVSVEELNNKYEIVSSLINEDRYKNYLNYLTEMNDLERIHRKMLLELLNPYEIDGLLHNYTVIPEMIDLCNNDKTKELLNIFTNDPIESLNNIIDEIESKFDLKQMKKYALSKIENSFFKRGANKEIDKLSDIINKNYKFLKEFNQKISDLIEKGSCQTRTKFKNKLLSILDKYDKSGYYIKTTNSRSKCLEISLKNNKFIEISGQKIATKDITLKKKDASNKRIECHLIETASNEMVLSQEKMKASAKEFYLQIMKDIHKKHNTFFKELERFVSELDVLVSSARCAIKNNYCRPICIDGRSSYIESKELRHPLVEKLTDVPYVSNDCNLKDGKNGILLYGVNGVGKSVFLKSIGLNIVLAQSGNFTAATTFKYCPFHTILTRILGSDNIFTNSSSFQVEMNELRAILYRANERSLVLTDELCRGTEFTSATALVASAIMNLSKLSSKFILTTHLHKLCDLEEIRELENVSIEHMKVIFDEDNKLIYDRKIERGKLENISYGVHIADKLGLSEIPNFIMNAEMIRKKLMNKSAELLPTKKSVYNAKLYVNDCEICGKKAIDTHHIKFQEDADEKGFFEDVAYHKNHIGNLVALCKKCHDEVHNGNLEIEGKTLTTDGIKVIFHRKEKKVKKGKYKEEQIERIISLKDEPYITQKKASIQLKKEGIDISAGTVGKYWRKK